LARFVLLGGFITVRVLGLFEGPCLSTEFILFTPLIAAMAGNVGVQSSAIIITRFAKNNTLSSLFNRLIREISLSLLNV
jgi:magnesium transporter